MDDQCLNSTITSDCSHQSIRGKSPLSNESGLGPSLSNSPPCSSSLPIVESNSSCCTKEFSQSNDELSAADCLTVKNRQSQANTSVSTRHLLSSDSLDVSKQSSKSALFDAQIDYSTLNVDQNNKNCSDLKLAGSSIKPTKPLKPEKPDRLKLISEKSASKTATSCEKSIVFPKQPTVQKTKSLKSLLKKSSDLSLGRGKNERRVKFNQTVIVFCEEIEVPFFEGDDDEVEDEDEDGGSVSPFKQGARIGAQDYNHVTIANCNDSQVQKRGSKAELPPNYNLDKELMNDTKLLELLLDNGQIAQMNAKRDKTCDPSLKPSVNGIVATSDKFKAALNQTSLNFLPNAQTQVIKRVSDERLKPKLSVSKNSIINTQVSNLVHDNSIRINTKTQDDNMKCYVCDAIESGTFQRSITRLKAANEVQQAAIINPNSKINSIAPFQIVSSCKACNDMQNQQASAIKPLSCEIVNIIDRNGFKVRALSVLYPPSSDGLNPNSDRRLFVANESLIQAHHIPQQTQLGNALGGNNQARSVRPVLLVQQPLDFNSHKGFFPNANEIRRLDGLRNRPNVSDNIVVNEAAISNLKPIVCTQSGVCNETEDPTFGFSSRPSVKGVVNYQTQKKPSPTNPSRPANNSTSVDCMKTSSSNSISNLKGLLIHPRETNKTTTNDASNGMLTYLRKFFTKKLSEYFRH